MKAGNLDEAQRLSRRAVRGVGTGQAATRLARYEVRMEEEQLPKARENLDLALGSGNGSAAVYYGLAHTYIKQGDNRGALEAVKRGWDDLGPVSALYPYMIYVTVKNGDLGGARDLVDLCKLAFREHANKCQRASEGVLDRESG